MQEFRCVAGLYTIPTHSNKPDQADGRKFYVLDNQMKNILIICVLYEKTLIEYIFLIEDQYLPIFFNL